MRISNKSFIFFVLFCITSFSCNNNRTSVKKEKCLLEYLTEINAIQNGGEATYLIVPEYTCNSCLETMCLFFNEKETKTVFILVGTNTYDTTFFSNKYKNLKVTLDKNSLYENKKFKLIYEQEMVCFKLRDNKIHDYLLINSTNIKDVLRKLNPE